MFLLLANIFLLFVGCFMETIAAITILVPVFMPIIAKLGIDPVHFGLVMVLNLMIGLLTPPVGMVLFVLQKVARISFEATVQGDAAVDVAAARHARASSPTGRQVVLWLPSRALPKMSVIDRVEILQVEPAAQGGAHRRDPVVRHAGNAAGAHHVLPTAPRATGYTYTIGTGGSSVRRRCCATTSRRG